MQLQAKGRRGRGSPGSRRGQEGRPLQAAGPPPCPHPEPRRESVSSEATEFAVLCDGSRGTLIQQIIKTLGTNYKIENEFLTIVLNKSNPEF